jgi:hypothetical protein
MALTAKLGVSAWDAVTYVRNRTEDITAPFIVPDSAYDAYIETVTEDFSRHVPLDYVIGDPYANTSPLVTVTGQMRYVCTSGNGFVVEPSRITDVLYRAASGYNASSEMAYLAILPFSAVNRFLSTPNLLDSPSERVLRDGYLNELAHYGQGYYWTERDSTTGRMVIVLVPIPGTSGLPVFVRFQGDHQIAVSGTDRLIPTIPETYKRVWANLLYAEVLEQESERLMREKSLKAGLVDLMTDPRLLALQCDRIRQDAYAQLGGMTGVAAVSW